MLTALANHWRAYLMEAGGLMVFMLGAGALGTLFLYPGSPVQQALPSDLVRRCGLGVGMGLVTLAVAVSIGGVSGAHINPAVTWTLWRCRRIGMWDAIFYTVAQVAGAIVAPALLVAVIGAPVADAAVQFPVWDLTSAALGIAFAAEFVISFVLAIVLLAVLASRRLAPWSPVILSTLIALYIVVESPLSGMSLNPARSLGAALVLGHWRNSWIYLVAPTAAMLLAGEVHARSARLRGVADQVIPHYPIDVRDGSSPRVDDVG